MRIVRIEASTVRLELTTPYITADYKGKGLAGKTCVIVRMTTDDGITGIGESDAYPTFTYESPETVLEIIRNHIAPAVLGADPANIVGLHQKMDTAIAGWPFAKSPIDVAAYDILGKSLNQPVHQLLGGQLRDRIPMLWPVGGASPEENAREVSEKMKDEGYESFHIKLGALTPDEDVARIAAVREAVGDGVPLMVDINQGWDRTTALRTIRRLEPYQLSIIEQPVPAWDLDGLAMIQASVDAPISADESLHSIHDAVNLIRRDAVRVFSLKTGKLGGLFRTRQIAAIAEAAGIPCFVNSMIEMGVSVATSVHLAASIPNIVGNGHGHALMSNLRIKKDILKEESFSYDGRDILVPQDCGGLGVELDENELEERTVERFVSEFQEG